MTEPKKESNQLTQKELTASERFMNKVVAEFGAGVGEIALTDFQKRLAQNYFIAIDSALKMAEEKRQKKSEKYRDAVPVLWGNVNMELLARAVVSAARIGLDPAQSNHVAMMPFKNNALKKYGIVFIEGYRGKEMKAKKYGLDIPDHVIVELVYSNDKFKSYKKDRNNQYETYDFEVVNDFDRGQIIGGFYYHLYIDKPEKNKLVVLTLKDIEKRKPAYATPEFWGGEKDVWKDGKKTGAKEKVEGWYEKMCWKTIYRAAYGDITIDSQKIDDDYMRLKAMEETLAEAKIAQEIAENANTQTIDVEHEVTGETEQGNDQAEAEQEPPKQDPPAQGQPEQITLGATGTDGPGF
jgi:recombination protein RecT